MLRLLPLALLLVAADVSAQHDTRVRLSGPITTTPISGDNGDGSFLIATDEPHAFLASLSFLENSDEPCYIEAGFAAYSNGRESRRIRNHTSANNPSFNCSNSANSTSRETVRAGFPPNGGYAAIHGIRVCTNDRNENNLKLKGARAFVSMLNRDGNGQIVRDRGLADEFDRQHCRSWETPRRCAVGQVAVGVQVFYRNGTNDSITGLALRCQRATVTNIVNRVRRR